MTIIINIYPHKQSILYAKYLSALCSFKLSSFVIIMLSVIRLSRSILRREAKLLPKIITMYDMDGKSLMKIYLGIIV